MGLQVKISSGHIGVVLKNYEPKSSKIALVDKELGRIDGVVFSRTICVGSLLHYDVQRGRNGYLLEHVKVDNLPLALARSDLLFFHHVLELCYYFIPVASEVAGIFELLQFLYTVEYSACSKQSKKLFVLKLLATIGLYSEVSDMHEQTIRKLLAVPLNMIVHELLDEASEKIMDDWLLRCIAEHPFVKYFNTMHFLITNGSK